MYKHHLNFFKAKKKQNKKLKENARCGNFTRRCQQLKR